MPFRNLNVQLPGGGRSNALAATLFNQQAQDRSAQTEQFQLANLSLQNALGISTNKTNLELGKLREGRLSTESGRVQDRLDKKGALNAETQRGLNAINLANSNQERDIALKRFQQNSLIRAEKLRQLGKKFDVELGGLKQDIVQKRLDAENAREVSKITAKTPREIEKLKQEGLTTRNDRSATKEETIARIKQADIHLEAVSRIHSQDIKNSMEQLKLDNLTRQYEQALAQNRSLTLKERDRMTHLLATRKLKTLEAEQKSIAIKTKNEERNRGIELIKQDTDRVDILFTALLTSAGDSPDLIYDAYISALLIMQKEQLRTDGGIKYNDLKSAKDYLTMKYRKTSEERANIFDNIQFDSSRRKRAGLARTTNPDKLFQLGRLETFSKSLNK